MPPDKKNIIVIGAGLVGSLLGIFLARKGYKVSVYERRPDVRLEGQAGGRSINLALSDRGIKALERVGIIDRIREIAIPMHGRKIHNPDGTTAFQPYGKQGQFINSVSRGELNKSLVELAASREVEFFFDHKCEEIDWKEDKVKFIIGEEEREVKFDLLFGSDGAYSNSRLQHMINHDRFEYHQTYIDYGYKELEIPAGKDGSFLLEKNALHIWPRGNYMLIALPNPDGSFTCTLFFPFEGDPSFATLDSPSKVSTFFRKTFTDAFDLMPGLEKDFFNNPTSSLVTVKCFPWIRDDKFLLIGDAAHAIVPFFGQGMNCGFEDCTVLDGMIDEFAHDWKRILAVFQEKRKPDADAIAELALTNFVEMRDRVADPKFLLQKKIESKLHEKFPDKWVPAYSQVTFSPEIRYSEALERGNRQEEIMREVMGWKDIEENWSDERVLSKIIAQL